MSSIDPLAHEPFSYSVIKGHRLQIYHKGKLVKVLRHNAAVKFLDRIEGLDIRGQQLVMAKETGQFKFGNEHV